MLVVTPRKKNPQVTPIADQRLLIDAWWWLVELLVLFLLSMTTTKHNHVTAFVVRHRHRHDHDHHHHKRRNGRGRKLLYSSSSSSSLLSSSSTFFANESIDSHPTRKKIQSGRRMGGRYCNKRNQKRNAKNEIQYKNKNRIDGDSIKTEINNNTCTMIVRIEDIFHQPCPAWNKESLFAYVTEYFETDLVHDQYGRPWKLKVVFRQQQKNLIQRILTYGGIDPNDDQQGVVKNNNEEGVAFIVQFVGSSSEKDGVGLKSLCMSVPNKDDSLWYDKGYTDIPSRGSDRWYPIFFWLPGNYLTGIYLPKEVVQFSQSNEENDSLLDVKIEFECEDPRWVRFRNSVSPEPPVFLSTGKLAYHKENDTPLLYEVVQDVADAVAVIAESLLFAIVVESFIHHFVAWSMGGGFFFNDPVVDVLLDVFRSSMG